MVNFSKNSLSNGFLHDGVKRAFEVVPHLYDVLKFKHITYGGHGVWFKITGVISSIDLKSLIDNNIDFFISEYGMYIHY